MCFPLILPPLPQATRGAMSAAGRLCEALEGGVAVPELVLVGRPDMCVVAFKARDPKVMTQQGG